jgi:uncharacterized membrane protein YidH (DUF202 family)
MGSVRHTWQFLLAGVVTFLVGTFLWAYGAAMAFFVPGYIGESYFSKGRLLLGVLLLLMAVAVLSMAGWFFFRSAYSLKSPRRTTLPTVIGYCFVGSIGMILLYAVVGALIYQQ